jgi:hypothetical protein
MATVAKLNKGREAAIMLLVRAVVRFSKNASRFLRKVASEEIKRRAQHLEGWAAHIYTNELVPTSVYW